MADTEVQLPAGGTLRLQSVEEVEVWEATFERYQDAYSFSKPNDLILLGAILSQQLTLFRAQQRLNGMEPNVDAAGVPTGTFKMVEVKSADMKRFQVMIQDASKEIRALEQSLGIDKKSREAGGQHTVASYIEDLKLAASQMGVHIAKRVKAYEQFAMDLRWKVRLLQNGDDEDKAYHGLSDESVLQWCRDELAKLEEIDRAYAKERGRVWLGRL